MPLTAARMTTRVTFLIQLLLGIGLWTGRFDVVKPIHIVIGVIFVLGTWAVALLALRAGGTAILAGGIVAWGVLLGVFGLTQESILSTGPHWIVQVLHLLVAMVAIGLSEMLARRTFGR